LVRFEIIFHCTARAISGIDQAINVSNDQGDAMGKEICIELSEDPRKILTAGSAFSQNGQTHVAIRDMKDSELRSKKMCNMISYSQKYTSQFQNINMFFAVPTN